MPLTPEQRARLLANINILPLNRVLPFIVNGEITVEELRKAHISAERMQIVTNTLGSMPSPAEQQQWQELLPKIGVPSRENLDALNSYIARWEGAMPPQNHVADARNAAAAMTGKLREAERGQDDALWSTTDRSSADSLRAYISAFPSGLHSEEAKMCLEALQMQSTMGDADIFKVAEMVSATPIGPKADRMRAFMQKLKGDEIEIMKEHPERYDIARLKQLIEKRIFSESELVDSGVITRDMLDTLLDPNMMKYLPDIGTAIKNSTAHCSEGCTDVYFFGVPSTGKTCVLMGLTRSLQAHINLASAGGKYAEALMQYVDSSLTVPRTPGSFVTTLEASFNINPSNPFPTYRVNLVEMSGEEFAFDIANNANQHFDFESMGTGATRLLMNNNRKIFFLIIDPTLTRVAVKREVRDHFDPMTGQPVMRTEQAVINQALILHKMVDIFRRPENAQIMRKVDGIHLIMTKSDVLASNRTDRDAEAVKLFQERYQNEILQELINVCSTYGINANVVPQYHPYLYPFSLGRFSLGGLYTYESDDSDRLVTGICQAITNTQGQQYS